jgi:hypothetical protein
MLLVVMLADASAAYRRNSISGIATTDSRALFVIVEQNALTVRYGAVSAAGKHLTGYKSAVCEMPHELTETEMTERLGKCTRQRFESSLVTASIVGCIDRQGNVEPLTPSRNATRRNVRR